MEKYDVRTSIGVDFIYIGNDVNGNCKYAVNYRYFLTKAEEDKLFNTRVEIARRRAKAAFFDREITSHIEPFFVIRPVGNFIEVVKNINKAKRQVI